MEGRIQSALISVFNKENLEPIIEKLKELNVTMYSTGGTRTFIEECGADCVPVEEVTGYPSILGGRVKTLHPKIFGGILARRDHNDDLSQLYQYEIPLFDLVIVDLYPFEETIAKGSSKSVNLEFERGANCTQALVLSVAGTSVGAASSGTISGVFTPNNSTGSTSSLALSVGSSVAPGVYSVDLNADGCPTGVSTSILVTVP